MIVQYQLQIDDPQQLLSESLAYPLYAILLSYAPPIFAEQTHHQSVTPISQYLWKNCWYVSLMGECAIEALSPVLDTIEELPVRKVSATFRVIQRKRIEIASLDEFLEMPVSNAGNLILRTPTAFKQKGVYQLLPIHD